MYEKPKIRVIKRNAVAKPLGPEIKLKRATTPDIVSIVASWIRELHVRKSNDTKVAIERLFAKIPQSGKL